MRESPTVFSAFNARALSPIQVAKTFISSSHFYQLAENSNAVVVGPRGSGKTTLLKMLEQPALENWRSDEAVSFREKLGFTGVYIPIDVTWATQLSQVASIEGIGQSLATSAFNLHVLRSLLQAIEYRAGLGDAKNAAFPYSRVELSRSQEQEFVGHLAELLSLTPRIPTLLSMRVLLAKRLSSIYDCASKAEAGGAWSNRPEEAIVFSDFVPIVTGVLDALDGILGQSTGNWALMFDELEIAPLQITKRLITCLRSREQRLLFKLSLSPCMEEHSTQLGNEQLFRSISPTERNDFASIQLWYPSKKESLPFCSKLTDALFRDAGYRFEKLEEVLGNSEFDTDAADWAETGTAYADDSRLIEAMKSLASKDPTFCEYLKHKSIDILNPQAVSGKRRAQTLRKIRTVVIYRNEFLQSSKKLRSRKQPNLYYGLSSVLAISEGNPRLVKGIIGQMISASVSGVMPISKRIQSQSISAATARFVAMLRTLPLTNSEYNFHSDIMELLDRIGRGFARRFFKGRFRAEPPLSFKVDNSLKPQLQKSLALAVNSGALIWIRNREDSFVIESLQSRIFRLSYLLAPRFHLPLVQGKECSLTPMLDAESQMVLFDMEDTND